jgi:ATP-dependent DNA helicase RecG
MAVFTDTPIEFLKGVGPQKADVLKLEAGIHTFGDLLDWVPFRYVDRSVFNTISDIHHDMPFAQLLGEISFVEMVGEGKAKRLVAYFFTDSGEAELIWFKGFEFVRPMLIPKRKIVASGRPSIFKGKISFPHPELEVYNPDKPRDLFEPVYNSTEKMKKRFFDSRGLHKLIKTLLQRPDFEAPDFLPEQFRQQYGLIARDKAYRGIHAPSQKKEADLARYRFKFEELFLLQMNLNKVRVTNKDQRQGYVLSKLNLFNVFYKNHMPFDLTEAQKRVIREIRADVTSGKQMNRLLQGDVGSGKTMVAFLCMLMAVDNGLQAALMAPTEILAQQHFSGMYPYAQAIGVELALLTGSTTKAERTRIADGLEAGTINMLVGTHALIENKVAFKQTGLVIVDEQHRFGVEQRARLRDKNQQVWPHVLVMTATPIPRTLAMTVYGDLDVSVIDELPPGRKPIVTRHAYENKRQQVYSFLRSEIKKGRQVYVVYPLIEESATLDLKNLMDGYEHLKEVFPDLEICMVHGRMKPVEKQAEMQRFVSGKAHMMVATTVIEVGVNVPNASVMLIESAERFGLSQLHQLRGRVGRGADESYCILMSDVKLSKDSKTRIETMVRTSNGFEIAEADLRLRGPGDLAGTQQSGIVSLKFTDLAQDHKTIELARQAATQLLTHDPELNQPVWQPLLKHLQKVYANSSRWRKVG